LNRAGYTVGAPLLAGHGATPEHLKNTSWEDWVASAILGLEQLKKRCAGVIAVGHSMGGLIALHLAAKGMAEGVVSINAPIIYRDNSLHHADQLLGIQDFVKKPYRENEISVSKEGLPHFSYVQVPVSSFVSLNQAIALVRRELSAISCPAFIIQSLEDRTVDPRSGRIIEEGIGSSFKKAIFWPGEDHYLPLSAQREELAVKIVDFLENTPYS
jgi:carboxylesterase